MSTTDGFVRRPRITPPRAPGGELNIQPPPDVPRVVPGGMLLKLLPVIMVVAVIGMLAMMFATGGRNILTNPSFCRPGGREQAHSRTTRRVALVHVSCRAHGCAGPDQVQSVVTLGTDVAAATDRLKFEN